MGSEWDYLSFRDFASIKNNRKMEFFNPVDLMEIHLEGKFKPANLSLQDNIIISLPP